MASTGRILTRPSDDQASLVALGLILGDNVEVNVVHHLSTVRLHLALRLLQLKTCLMSGPAVVLFMMSLDENVRILSSIPEGC